MLSIFPKHVKKLDTEETELVMSQLDLDGDGKMDYNEFLQGGINHRALLTKENIGHMFQLFDTNKDGYISMSELKDVFSTSRQENTESDFFLLDVIKEVDQSGNQMISYKEFEAGLLTQLFRIE